MNIISRVSLRMKFLLGCVLFLLGNSLFSVSAATPICSNPGLTVSSTTCEALAGFYDKTLGYQRTNDTNWLQSPDVGTWYGVQVTSGVVTELQLHSNNVIGTVPEEIGLLTGLQLLSLENNLLTTIHPAIDGAVALRHLNLGWNNITGVPVSLGNMTGLTDLSLEHNAMSVLPNIFSGMTDLEVLYVQHNSLAALPDSLGMLSSLAILDVSFNQLTTLPPSFDQLTGVHMLDLEDNALSALPVNIGNMTSLEVIYAQSNQLTALPESIGLLNDLYYLAVQHNQLTTLPESLLNAQELKYIRADENQLTDLPSSFSGLQELTTLYLNNNALTSLPSGVEDIVGLRFLYLQDNMITGRLPDSYSQLTSLYKLFLQNNYIDRASDPLHDVVLSPALTTWKNNLVSNGRQVLLHHQQDKTAPVLTGSDEVTGRYTTGTTMQIAWEEESYAMNASGAGLSLVMSGDANCQDIQLSPSVLLSATGNEDIQLSGTGVYTNCSIHLQDHAGNYSSGTMLNNLVFSTQKKDYCQLSAFTTSTTIPAIECEVLVDIYEATGGDTWTNNNNWFRTTQVELWHGIRTANVSGQQHVDGLFLHKSTSGDQDGFFNGWNGNNLQGIVPPSIAQLSELVHVNVSKNLLGVLPNEVTTLPALTHLIAVDAGITGVLPENMNQLDTLEVLNLQLNSGLTGTLHSIQGMDALESLLLAQTNISGAIPETIATNTNLEDIRLAGTQLTGTLPVSLSSLSALRMFDIGSTRVGGRLSDDLMGLTNLTQFIIEYSNFDRTNTHDAVLTPGLSNRLAGISITKIGNQGDTTASTIASIDTLPNVATGTMTYTIDISENSYAVDLGGSGMDVVMSGSGACTSLVVSQVMIQTGQAVLSLTPSLTGGYIGCTMVLEDHGGNISNALILPSFVFGVGNESVCREAGLTVGYASCVALVEIYESLQGDMWFTTTNWLESPDIDTWYGVSVSGGYVTEISMGGAYANNLSGSLPDVFANLSGLTMLDLSENMITGELPSSLASLDQLEELFLQKNQFTGLILSELLSLPALDSINLSENSFSGPLPTSIGGAEMRSLDVHGNQLEGNLPNILSGSSVQILHFSDNQFAGELPISWELLTNIETIDLHRNQLTGILPSARSGLTNIKNISLSENNLSGELPVSWSALSVLEVFDVSKNMLTGMIPQSRTALTNLTDISLQENAFNRFLDPSHEIAIEPFSATELWRNNRTTAHGDKQTDITPPVLSTTTTLPTTMTDSFYFNLSYNENSYALDAKGDGLVVGFTGNSVCGDMVVDQTQIKTMSGSTVLTISPYIAGVYNCFLTLTDHGGNVGSVYMGPFEFITTCGNGIIDPGEACDEGKFCDDMTPCTADPTICPGQCRPRLIDTCNASCEPSRCGDGYIDPDGIDNILGNYDDETCDERSYCDDGTDCTRDASICAGSCRARFLNDCNEFCTAGTCGDGSVDVNGADDILGTPDDEECDDGNPYNGDACSTNCTIEYCGDAYVDPNGGDNIVSTADDEGCDLGSSNGILGGLCSSTCEVPNSECVYCYEVCDGGTGSNSMFLLMDISGSMNNNNRLTNAKAGATNFVDLIASGAITNTGFVTKVGVIAFSNTASTLINPTTDYTAVKSQIATLSAGGGTNFGDPIRDAIAFFETYDTSFDQHMILLSDGEPTVSSNASFTPGEWALYQSDNAKARGINLYTIAVDQTDEGLTYMSYLSSSTLINRAWQGPNMNKPVSQSTTDNNSATYDATKAADAFTDGSSFSLTDEEYQARWEINLNSSILIDQIHLWNRTSNTNETSDVWVHVSDTTYGTDSLDEILADPFVHSYFITGEVERSSSLDLNGLQGKYVRVQLSEENPGTYPDWETFSSSDPGGTSNYSNNQDVTTTYCPANSSHKLTLTFDAFNTEQSYDFLKVYNGNTTSDPLVANLHGSGLPSPITSTSGDGCLTLNFTSDYSVTKSGWQATLDNGQGPESFSSVDPGGASNYPNNQNVTNTYCPANAADKLTVTFSSFNTEQSYDFLKVYNGNTTSDPLIANLHGSGLPSPITSTSGDGCLTLNFTSDYSVTKSGWQAVISTVTSNTTNLGLSEVQIIGCDASDPECTDVFHYQDFGGAAIEILYGHIFGSIHCGCRPEQVCGICGDGILEPIKGETCDEGSYCDDGVTNCTADSTVCAASGLGECRPRFINGCTDTCVAYFCGDGEINQATELCDDGNNVDGDGCHDDCTIEACGDGFTDGDGADNIRGTVDDELCDDGNTVDGDGCGAACLFETCGDGFVDLNGPDNDSATSGDNEQCDTGRTCNDGTDCTLDPMICPGECSVSYVGLCNTSCTVGSCGDAVVQSGTLVVGSGSITLDESCDLGMFCEDNFTPCTQTPHFCSLLGIGGGTCAPRALANCTPQCALNICGDGWVSASEQCDDGNNTLGDGCTPTCITETCGDGIIDSNGPDNIINTLDDELCDDGNMINGDGCSSCKLDTCGNGILDLGEACDTIDADICVLPYCRLTTCGDNIRHWPNGTQSGGIGDAGYEACDGSAGCQNDCTYVQGITFCGDDVVQGTGNNQGFNEVCDDGVLNGKVGYCATDCARIPTCGDGIVTDAEQCDDGNLNDTDGCSSLCMLESPFSVPSALSGACSETMLPVINPGELLPMRRQIIPYDAVDETATSCGDIHGSQWIVGTSMACTFSVKKGGLYGLEDTGIDIEGDCLETVHTSSLLVQDAMQDQQLSSPSYPVLGSSVRNTSGVSLFDEQQGKYVLTLDEVAYTYCVDIGSGTQTRNASVAHEVCSLNVGVTPAYFIQDGSVFKETKTSSLTTFLDQDGAQLFTAGTALDDNTQEQSQVLYQGSDIGYLTNEFSRKYKDKATEEKIGIWDGVRYKVPNERIYVYPGSQEITLDTLTLEQLVKDVSIPFTLIIEDTNLIREGSLGGSNQEVSGMFVVHGEVSFSMKSCDTTQIIQGIWIADAGFTSENTKNIDTDAPVWCSGGNIIVYGSFVGPTLDILQSARRGVLNAWDENHVYTSYQNESLMSSIGRKVFDICYLPNLLQGLSTPLKVGGVTCNHTNSKDFVDDALGILSNYVQEVSSDITGVQCLSPDVCTAGLPSYSCLYDDTACEEKISFTCNQGIYTCTMTAEEDGLRVLDQQIAGCVDTVSGCELVEKSCTIDAANMVSCLERCNEGAVRTCPQPLSDAWHETIEHIITKGYTGTQGTLPPLEHIRNAFITYNDITNVLQAAPFTMTTPSEDTAWFSSSANQLAVRDELAIRRGIISEGASLYIEAAPWLRTNLPPGGDEMLSRVDYLEK